MKKKGKLKKRLLPKKEKKVDPLVGFWGRNPLERERLVKGFEEVDLTELTPWEDNPRFNNKAVKPLADLIDEHGFAGVIVCTPDGTIWSGNTRFKAVQLLGRTKIWVQWLNFDSLQAAEDFALSDNKASEWAEWDHGKLAEHFKKRRTVDIAMLQKITGFKKQEIEWQGEPAIDVDKLDDFEMPEQEFTIKITGITEVDKDSVLSGIKEALEGSGYAAKIY